MDFLIQVMEERERQATKWNADHDDHHTLFDWGFIFRSYLDRFVGGDDPKRDCVVLAALAMAAHESLERRGE
jgi:hypothetical protein